MTKGRARAIADTAEGTILATVTIGAPPERVFRAITSDEVTAWWGSPDTYRTTSYRADLVVGGSWRAEGTGANGPFAVGGVFLEIDPPRKLVQTWLAQWDGNVPTTVTWRLEPVAGGTLLTLRHEGFAGRPDSCRGHAEGWMRVLGWLDGFAAEPGPAAAFFFCRLIPPRPRFAFDMSEEERAVMAAHSAYWRERLGAGEVVVFGPVADPAGPWGLGVVRAADPAAVEAFAAADPAILSGRGFRYEILPMLTAVTAA
jgi:uncharacterized protein YndB with AHSA1/START domain